MNTVNYITPSDGDIYLVNNQTYVNSGGTDFDKIYNNILKNNDNTIIVINY